MKRELAIEWRHYDKEGATCDRCAATGTSVKEVVAELAKELDLRGVTVKLKEISLPQEQMAQSKYDPLQWGRLGRPVRQCDYR